jgi:transglutaminase-like putative cysteine protease
LTSTVHIPWQRLREDIPNLLLLVVILLLTSISVTGATGTGNLPGIAALAILGLLAGYLLAYTTFSELTALVMAAIYGGFAVGLQQSLSLPSSLPLRGRSLELLQRVVTWTATAATGGYAQDALVLILLLALIAWFLGYNAAWQLFRAERLWRAVVPPGVVLLAGAAVYTGDLSLGLLPPAYLLGALLLAVRTNAAAREGIWRDQRMSFAPRARAGLLRAGFAASVLLLALAWLTPTASAGDQLASAWQENFPSQPDLRETLDRLFALDAEPGDTPADYYGGPALTLGGSINLDERHVMDVYAPTGPRYYWRSTVFDTFDGRTWTTTSDARLTSEFGVLYYEDANYQMRRNVRQRFVIHIPSAELIYSAAQPTSVSLPVTFDVLYIDRGQERGSPTTLQANTPLQSGDTYETISSISYADEVSLRTAGTEYPGWVQRTYLQLPDTTSSRTRELAAYLTALYDNPYDRAVALERWLRDNVTYDESVSAPPPDTDAVDWTLFEQRRGYSNHYASAMVVMLRAQGIPTRLATGFAQGEYIPESGAFRVVESDAHAWVEVYFPGYGWVEFEPTAIQPAFTTRGVPGGEGTGGTASAPAQTVEEAPPGAPEAPSPDTPEVAEDDGDFLIRLLNLTSEASRVRLPLKWLLVMLGIGVLAGSVWVWQAAGRHGLRRGSRVERAYAWLNLVALWLDLHLPPSATPNERAAALGVEAPEAAVPVHDIAALYVRERFSPASPADASTQAGAAWQAARPHLLRRAFRRFLRRRFPF